jgi:signal transduction histidine kinase
MRDFPHAFVEDTADANERVFAVARGAFTLAVLVHFIVVEIDIYDRVWVIRAVAELPFYLACLGFSAWILHQGARRRLTRAERSLSVVIDAVSCFGLLLTNVLWPWPTYDGILHTPDAAAILLTAVAAGYRLSRNLVWVAGALNLATIVGLWALDLVLGIRTIEAPGHVLGLYLLYFASGIALAMLQVRRTESLVHRVAKEAQQRLRTAARLKVVLHAQHDVRSPLAAAVLNARLLRDHLRSPTTRVAALVEDLTQDLDEVNKLMNEHHTHLTPERPVATVSADALQVLLAEVGPKLQALEIQSDLQSRNGMVVAGGAWAMRRLLVNLLTNSAEGDGTNGASRCVIRTFTEGSMVRLTVEDDGPGFPPSILAAAPHPGRTTKEHGSGLGLTFAQWVVEDSGGHLARANTASGAQVSVLFLRAGEA